MFPVLFPFGTDHKQVIHADSFHHFKIVFPFFQTGIYNTGIGNEHVDKMAPGMAFVPWQEWKDVYDMEKGLERGTIFEELDKPYLGRPIK